MDLPFFDDFGLVAVLDGELEHLDEPLELVLVSGADELELPHRRVQGRGVGRRRKKLLHQAVQLTCMCNRHEQWQCPGLNANANGFCDTQINANVNANGFLRLLSMPMSMAIVFSAPYQCQFQCQCPMFWLNVNANVNTCVNDLPLFVKSSF